MDYFKLLVKQEFQACWVIMGPRPRINFENQGKVLVLSEKSYSQQEEEEGISVMDWPAQSPNLNPIVGPDQDFSSKAKPK